MNIAIRIFGVACACLLIPVVFAGDSGPEAAGETSANGVQCKRFDGLEAVSLNRKHKISLRADLHFIVEEKDADGSWKKVTEGRVAMSHPHPSVTITDDGRFGILNPCGGSDTFEDRFFLYGPNGVLIKKLNLTQLLVRYDAHRICIEGTDNGHLSWLKSDVRWETDERNVTPEHVQELITRMNGDDAKVRDAAQKELIEIGRTAVPYLEKAAKSDDVEMKTRSENALKDISCAGRWVFETTWDRMIIIHIDG